MKTVFATQTPPSIASVIKVIASHLNPIHLLLAQEQFNKFRALDDATLLDVGLTHADVRSATLSDFLKAPRH